MKNLLSSFLCLVLLVLLDLSFSASSQYVPQLEQQRDELIEKRFAASLAALREMDDQKAVAMLRAMTKEYIAGMEKLRPAYEQWYKKLSAEEKMQLVRGLSNKKWIPLMQEIQFDRLIQERFRNNLNLKREYDHLQFICDRATELNLD